MSMHLFESLDAILLIALVLLVIARKISVPYPTLLAAAGLGFAALPFAPRIEVEPHLVLALFIAPALLHAAYGTSPRGLRRHWFALVALAVFAVIVTTAAVAALGMWWAGLPFAAALALGAIVAPPDAAAADAVLGEVGLPRRGLLILQGESLLNDATALLLLGFATTLAADAGTPALLGLAVAAPGGILFGVVAALVYLRVIPLFAGTLGSSLVDFAVTFAIWLLAERLHISSVLAVVTFGMIVAQRRPIDQPARDRLQTSAVWAAAVLVLNVVAFMLMGLQSREVIIRLAPADRLPAIGFALTVLAVVLLARIGWVLVVRGVEAALWKGGKGSHLIPPPPPWRASLIVSWAGMRGLITLAAAFSLPFNFPGRDLIVLSAFCVVIGTLLLQGLTLGWLIRRLGMDDDAESTRMVGEARRTLIAAGLAAIADRRGEAAQALRLRYTAAGHVATHAEDPQAPSSVDRLHLEMIASQRETLHAMRNSGDLAEDVYRRLQEELDWSEVDARSFSDNLLRPA